MRPVACPPFNVRTRNKDGGHGASAALPALRSGRLRKVVAAHPRKECHLGALRREYYIALMANQRRDPDHRPSPDALLETARREQSGTGRLKIFLGAAPGVGKTYEML